MDLPNVFLIFVAKQKLGYAHWCAVEVIGTFHVEGDGFVVPESGKDSSSMFTVITTAGIPEDVPLAAPRALRLSLIAL
uniref:Uncharacterized protein n=1 Tax=Parascaris equorum TaxID=6256 RepID=A0A914RSZ9_PAREQ